MRRGEEGERERISMVKSRSRPDQNAVVQSNIIRYFSALMVWSDFTECLILQTILRNTLRAEQSLKIIHCFWIKCSCLILGLTIITQTTNIAYYKARYLLLHLCSQNWLSDRQTNPPCLGAVYSQQEHNRLSSAPAPSDNIVCTIVLLP